MFPENLLSALDFSRQQLDSLFALADRYAEDPPRELLRGLTVCTFFYEPSTRTRLTFEAAAQRLGAHVLSVPDAKVSSVVKGETIEDTAVILSGLADRERLADLVIFRHPEVGSVARAAAKATIPVINAGDGEGEHPSQTALDLYTLERKLGSIDGLHIAMVGDLCYGRTPHSLGRGLSLYEGVHVYLVAPSELAAPEELVAELVSRGIRVHQTENLDEVLPHARVFYVTRVQKERIKDADRYSHLKGCYRIDGRCLDAMRPDALIMHPLPRVDEIAPEVDDDSRAIYFEQACNGIPVRKAILAEMLNRARYRGQA